MVRAYLNWSLPYCVNSLTILMYIYVTEVYHRPFLLIWAWFGLLPALDLFVADDYVNPTEEEAKVLKSQSKWMFPLYLYVVLEWVAFFWSFSYLQRHEMTIIEYSVFLLSISTVTGIGFLFAHELFHRREFIPRFVGTFDMMKSLYMHYNSEHIDGHHKNVSTPKDATTARYGQNLYFFLCRQLLETFTNSWTREAKKVMKRGKSRWSLENRMNQWLIEETLFTIGIALYYGRQGLIFFLLQAFLSSALLETVSYIRHYGLFRKKMSNGDYEPITPHHSWNAAQTLQNFMLLKLQRHSDHHANSYKPYQILENCADAPNLPCGYGICILSSFIPQVWYAIVHPLLPAANEKRNPTEEELSKSKRAVYLWYAVQVAAITGLAFVL